MIRNFSLSDKIGDVVTVFPGASDLFLKYKIDFCCGGNRPLIEAMDEQNLDGNKILTLLQASYEEFQEKNEEFTDWAKEKPSKLVDYIVSVHHRYLKEELPKISELTFKILRVHGSNHEELFKVHKLFNTLRTELEGHLVKEEEFLFPIIKEYDTNRNDSNREKVLKLINELEDEHTGAGDIIKELREVTEHYIVPKDACRTFQVTYEKLRELEIDTFQHIHLENNILFKNI
ncbi:iron-sulfur cluster repair di-iron protein [Clostridium cellulovorans]|uniref:Iron-sulfur cluster repair di-iron protein n=1 Tax=Clostridium cellulovorans (strain ATCC 35296 / DSM 3052 / OCM 3 / 743B) TaxID=573061 RepID=D9SWI5_CLOC7|nr:iron-sulfur cluster repair di-iron protein [Clostridium cellulovorans]ADL53267.1 iron-sulfur cluster repair di-iron protein [Clostridium cellulovorans 743B]